MKVWVYIDGFNFYNGLLRNTAYKWLDLLKFSQALLPADQIDHVKYFSAKVNARVNDPDQPVRQIAYWRALRTLGCVKIIEGHFLSKSTWMPEAASVLHLNQPAASGVNVAGMRPNMIEVFKAEEKGTDVNLATHLVKTANFPQLSQMRAARLPSLRPGNQGCRVSVTRRN